MSACRRLACLVALVLIAPTPVRAQDQIAQAVKEVEAAREQSSQQYNWRGASTLKEAMDHHEVKGGRDNLSAWGSWISSAWQGSAYPFYRKTLDALNEFSKAVGRRALTKQELDGLARGMAAFRQAHQQVDRLMNQYVDTLARGGDQTAEPAEFQRTRDALSRVESELDGLVENWRPAWRAGAAPAKVVSLRYVEQREGKYVPIVGELKHGSVFYIEATFDAPPREKSYTVALDWDGGTGTQVTVTPTSEATLFRSGAIRLQAPTVKP